MYSNFSSDISTQFESFKKDKTFNFFIFIIVIIIIIFAIVPWNELCKNRENMSGGTMSQMFAQDSQDAYLKGNIDKIGTSNFNLMFNQPTRQSNVFLNRGTPLYSILLPDTQMNPTNNIVEVSNNYIDSIIANDVDKKENKLTFSNPVLTSPDKLNNNKSQQMVDLKKNKFVQTIPKNILPSSLNVDVLANSNPYELALVSKQTSQTKNDNDETVRLTNWTDENKLFQIYTDRNLNQKNCINDPASCTGFSGGRRLDDFVQSTKAIADVKLDNNYFFPDSYVGSYWIEPNFDINKPYPYIPDSNRV